ncbi:MAG: type II secretion system F family protein [Chlamydiota bacterium]
MALFRYWALTPQGKRSVGIVNADSMELAKEMLRNQQILVTRVAAYEAKKSRLSFSASLLLDFTRGMATLLKAGLPLYETLQILKEKHRQSKLYTLFLNLSEQIKHGQQLSAVLFSYPKVFNAVYVAMVRAGEESGTLAESFDKLFVLIEKDQKLRKKVLSALMYPLFLAVFCLGVLAMLFFFLIPSMRALFEERELHPVTQFVLDTSAMLNEYGAVIFTVLGCLLVGSLLFFRGKSGKKMLHRALYKMPVIQRVMTENVFARFCRVFALLLRSGIPLVESLSLAKCVMKQVVFEEAIALTEEKIISGGKLSEALQSTQCIPKLLARMIAIGEESGNLGEMMEHVATIYEEDVDRSLLRLTSLLQPIMLLIMGVIVAIVLLAVLLPITDVSSLG